MYQLKKGESIMNDLVIILLLLILLIQFIRNINETKKTSVVYLIDLLLRYLKVIVSFY